MKKLVSCGLLTLCALLPFSVNAGECDRLYIGAFGGGLFSNSSHVTQMGNAFFREPPVSIGPLAIIAEGDTNKTTSGFGGVQVGYEWAPLYSPCCSGWLFAPGLEAEAYFFSHKKRAEVINPTSLLDEHDFVDTFNMNMSTVLVNALLSFQGCSWGRFSPYLGLGLGATRISIRDADSLQISPPEAGVNHFNSRDHDADWAFTAQAKLGLRYNICKRFHIFGEYRYVYVDTSKFIFGPTSYPNHVQTSPWNVAIDNLQYSAFAVGLQYDL